MFHKSQSTIKSDTRGQTIQKLVLRSVRKPRILRSPFNYTKKKFTPRINSSFAEYDESVSPKVRFRSTSVDRPRRSSDVGIKTSLKSATFEESSVSLLNLAKKDLQDGKFSQAADRFSQVFNMTENQEALFNRAVCNMKLNKLKEAIVDLLNVIKENSIYSKSAYLNLVKCFQGSNEIDPAIRYISQGLSRFSKFEDGLLLRAKLYSAKKSWEKAKSDYKKYLKYNPNEEEAILGLAESYQKLGDLPSASKFLNDCPNFLSVLLMKARILFEMKSYRQSLDCLETFLSNSPCAEGFFLKAECHKACLEYTEAGLSYEQCIKYDVEQEYFSRSIYNIGAIRVREKDFYGALHTFHRCTKNKLREQRVLESFSDAVISLMKKEYKTGIKVLNKLLQGKEPVIDEYIMSCYCFRAYAYLALGAFEKCLQSLAKAEAIKSLDKASAYNKELAHALICASRLEFEKSNKRLDKAMKIFPRKVEPLVYKSSFLVFNAYRDEPPDRQMLKLAQTYIETAVIMRDPDSELLFYRAVLRYLLNNFQDCIEDMKNCIEKAEDNISDHYFLRGLAYASLKVYKEAIQDFTIALQLNDKNSLIYSYRGRCGFLMDDTNLAFADYQKYVNCKDKDPTAHLNAGILLMTAGNYDDAYKALEISLSLKYLNSTHYYIAKCSVLQNNIHEAICELKKMLKNEFKEGVQMDLEILQYLHGFLPCNESFEQGVKLWEGWMQGKCGEIFEFKYILWFKAVFLMYLGRYLEALEDFQNILEILHSKDTKLMTPDETLTSEEENCEVLYNIALCHLFGKRSQSILILEDLSEILNNKHKGQMLLLAGIIYILEENPTAAEKILKEAFRCDPEIVTPYLAKLSIKLLPLNTNSTFAEKFPLITLSFPDQPKIEVRPAISLPRILLPTLEFSVESEAKEFFFFKKVQTKPEAPWLNRVRDSIQFTDSLMEVDSEPTEITEREIKNVFIDDSQGSKRIIKSMVPLRHYSSELNKRKRSGVKKEDTPYDIVKKIQELCSRN